MNKKKIIFTFVGLITLLLSIIGVTVAYFIAGITGNDDASSLIVTTAKFSDLEYLPGEEIDFEDVLPGWSRTQTFSVRTKSAHTVAMPYKVILNWSNSGITDMEYLLTSDSADVTITPKAINTVSEDQHSVIATGTFPASENIQTHTFTLTLRFRETGANQDAQQGRNFNAVVTVLTEQETQMLYYSNDYPNGTPSLPWTLFCNDESTRLNCQILADNTQANEKYKGEVQSDAMFSSLTTADRTQDGLWLENRNRKTENGMDVYFFRGAVTNNKVIFANKYWRIVRINEDGSIKLALGGNTANDGVVSNNGTLMTFYYSINNITYDNNRYVGYMYGSSCNETDTYTTCHLNIIKSGLMTSNESWWDSNIGNNSTYANKVSSEAIYCNDRSVSSGTGIFNSITTYAATARLIKAERNPQFLCPQENDKFTGTNVNNVGNQALRNKPIGFLTADEYVYAGGLRGANESPNNYLFSNANDSIKFWWLGTPSSYKNGMSSVGAVGGSIADLKGGYYGLQVSGDWSLRPVLSLKADTIVTSGSDETAYNVD